jgi:SAM-dependent methyltransferase
MATEWEDYYQRGETPWEKRAASPGLVDLLAEQPIRGRVLVPGCGFGNDVRALAASGADVLGIDIAPSAVAAAEARPRAADERYRVEDLFNLPADLQGAFDYVWEHTCFCAIDPAQRPAYVAAVAGALRPGGELLAIFYLDPGQEHPEDGPPFGTSLAELDQLFLPRFELLREWLPGRAYEGREGREWMRHMRLTDAQKLS